MTAEFWTSAQQHASHARRRLEATSEAYDGDGEVNLVGYAGSLVAFAAITAGLFASVRLSGRQLPDRYSLVDVTLGGLATHKFTRLVSKASVTSPLRAPFTSFDAPAGSAELNEEARGEGVRHTVGELLTCPFCLGQWVGTGYVAGLAFAPRAARTWAALFSVTAIADFLQHGYARARAQ
jgi:hypothetical protein